MRTKAAAITLLVWMMAPVSAFAAQRRQSTECDSCGVSKDFGLAAAGVIANNLWPWAYHWYLRGDEWARLGFDVWARNITSAPEWDPNLFSNNQLLHPYHGSAYFNSARSSGYSYWQSIPFTIFGSLMWEYLMEDIEASISDLVNTSLGGVALGEATYRLSTALLENDTAGSGPWRAIAAFVVNPVGFINRFHSRAAPTLGSNPEQISGQLRSILNVGLRRLGDGGLAGQPESHPFLEFEFRYGDPFEGDYQKPFDFFDLSAQVNFGAPIALGRFQTKGVVVAHALGRSERPYHVIGLFQQFDYIRDDGYEFGGPSFSAGLLSRFQVAKNLELHTTLDLGALILGAVHSEHADRGRNYDYGSGLGLRFLGTINRSGYDYLTLSYAGFWVHTLDGADADHLTHFLAARLRAPVFRSLGVGLDYELYLRNSFFREFSNVHRSNPQLRGFLTWLFR